MRFTFPRDRFLAGLMTALMAALMIMAVPGQAHAADTVTATPSTVVAGETFTVDYTIDLPAGANRRVIFSVKDSALGELPDFTSLVSCTGNVSACGELATEYFVPVGGSTAPTTKSGSLTLRVDPGTPAGEFDLYYGSADISGTNFLRPGPTVTVTAAPQADLSSGTALTGSAVGSTISVTAQVTNNGPDTAGGVNLTTTLPAQVSGVTGLPGACTFNATAKTVTCTAPTLATGQTTAYTYTAQLSLLSLGALPVSTTATATTADPVPANNTSSGSCTAVTSLVILC
ncbi:DUF11 domain-containing protein [uncultured Streptomyces sp.]|uniref:DUF11 domain-containing protein n=1 Tax=uncultured Streptomyces sp. TaxID=174707 RepID=UPI002624BFE4|nr:DUF11 domain-containing protein [uncultured Streptomyces sp.]